ncbi:hypothetical protein GCM10020256_04940 [Streptomyces thermocoprophilus]
MTGRSPGRAFRRLWAAYAVSAYGSGLGFGALPLTAVLVVHASPAQVSALSAAGPAAGALVAVPLAPWVERHRKRAVMIGMDVCRFAAMASIPVAHWLGRLGFAQLLAVSAVVAAARIAAGAASGAFLKILLPERDLVAANARLESTNWSSIAVGPPLGGAAAGAFGPVTTVFADALSYLLSALCLTAVRARGDVPAGQAPRTSAGTAGGISAGLRHLLGRPGLRSLWINNMLVSGLIMATEPLLAVLLLRDLGFPPWQYGLAFAAPCLGGLVGSRLARRTVARHGRRRVLRVAGTLRAVWLIGLAATPSGTAGLVTVIAVELAIIVHMSLYTPRPRRVPARTDPTAPRRPHPHRVVRRPADGDRRPHRARRAARRRHRPPARPSPPPGCSPWPPRCSCPAAGVSRRPRSGGRKGTPGPRRHRARPPYVVYRAVMDRTRTRDPEARSSADPLCQLSLEQLRRRTSMKWRTYPEDVLPLWVAEMDVPLAEPVRRAVTEAVELGDTGYPAGTRYAEALAAFARDRWGWDGIDAQRTAIVPDVMLGIVEMIKLVSGPDDPVVVNSPVYPPFYQFVRNLGRRVVEAPLGEDGRIDFAVLEETFRRLAGRRGGPCICCAARTTRPAPCTPPPNSPRWPGWPAPTGCGWWPTRSTPRSSRPASPSCRISACPAPRTGCR